MLDQWQVPVVVLAKHVRVVAQHVVGVRPRKNELPRDGYAWVLRLVLHPHGIRTLQELLEALPRAQHETGEKLREVVCVIVLPHVGRDLFACTLGQRVVVDEHGPPVTATVPVPDLHKT
jgi:hypothetical protein